MLLEERGMVVYVSLTRKVLELKEQAAQIHFLSRLLEEDLTTRKVSEMLHEVIGSVPKMKNFAKIVRYFKTTQLLFCDPLNLNVLWQIFEFFCRKWFKTAVIIINGF